MERSRKLAALTEVLGRPQGFPRKGEHLFFCPRASCGSAAKGKAKLVVNLEADKFHCWVCGFGGRSLTALFPPRSPQRAEYLSGKPSTAEPDEELTVCRALPPEFTPLRGRSSPLMAMVLAYLEARGVHERSRELWRVGYCEDGPYRGRVVLPSFDREGRVNMFSARTIHKDVRPSYKLPASIKDVVSNEHMVDWSRPVYLVEGAFDQIAVGPQAICLWGVFLGPMVLSTLAARRPPVVRVCLDSDALGPAKVIAETLLSYDIPTSVVRLPGKDPAQVGGEAVEAAAGKTAVARDRIGLMRSVLCA